MQDYLFGKLGISQILNCLRFRDTYNFIAVNIIYVRFTIAAEHPMIVSQMRFCEIIYDCYPFSYRAIEHRNEPVLCFVEVFGFV